MGSQDLTGWEIEPLREQRRGARSPGHQAPVPTDARLQVLKDGGRYPGGHRARAPDP